MLMQLSMLLVLLLAATNAVAAAATRTSARGIEDGKPGALPEIAIAKPNCTDKCGNLRIPYPFGIGEGCYSRPEFSITCKKSNDERETTARLMQTRRMIVTNISLEEGELRIMQLLNRVCYDDKGNSTDKENQSNDGLRVEPPYTISSDRNMFVAVGCDTRAYIVGGRGNQTYTTGCITVCRQQNISGYAIGKNDDSCSGIGCCETKIPPLLTNLHLWVGSYNNHRRVWDFNPCSYAFVVQRGYFTFSDTSFQQLRSITRLPLVLDWQFSEGSCQFAKENGTLACKGNSECQNKIKGYICVCKKGFQGNPYLHDCQDIDECTTLKSPCTHGQCNNTVGNYTCICDSGYKNPEGEPIECFKVPSTKRLKISLGGSLGFSVLLGAIFWIYRKQRKSYEKKLKDKHSSAMKTLEEKLRNQVRILTVSDVEDATNNYNANKKVGEGRYAIVYRGVLDKQHVAIKKPKDSAPIDPKQSTAAPRDLAAQKQFGNDMTFLHQIYHKNVVRLVGGCLLKTGTPIMVYEFITRGSLYTHIHGKEGKLPSPPLGLKERLKIAAETAGALSYLHHDTLEPIIHGDVKTANILLDENWTPKLSDYGASRLVPKNENQESTLVHGTEGYVDPEYLETKRLTTKSDVYSFGVVLAELLTGRKAEKTLRKEFVAFVQGGTLSQNIDEKIVEKGHLNDEIVRTAADLAKRCLELRGEKRPSMREVAVQLLMRTVEQHPSGSSASVGDISAE